MKTLKHKSIKTGIFEKELLEWYAKNGRKHLPWRKKTITPYEVWVSEVMLQQTQVSRVIDYYTRFLEKFPTVFDLATATWEEFYPYYAGLGYYNRGRNMLQCAKVVVEKYKGKFPPQKAELLALPGIGEYTASAILSFAYGKNELALDTNVKKVLGRVFLGSANAEGIKEFSQKYYEEDCHSERREESFEDSHRDISSSEIRKKNKQFQKIPRSARNDSGAVMKNINAAIMDFSNSICLKIPRCGECPLKNICEYYETDGRLEEIFTKREKKSAFDTKKAKVYLFLHANHKEYYSNNKKIYKPFILSAKINTREQIKKYFRGKYNLELSVRPPHKKIFVGGESVMLVNAQIQTGKNPFFVFLKKDIKKFIFR